MLKSSGRTGTLPLTERKATGNFFSVLTHRFLVVFLISFFILFAFVTAFAACLVASEVQAKIARQIPTSITCLDRGANSFLSTIYLPGQKSSTALKIGERTVDAYRVALSREWPSYGMSSRLLAPALVSLSFSIYQLKAVYLI